MSLQVWLPLNGNLYNQGLSNCEPEEIANTTAEYSAGKIGVNSLKTASKVTYNLLADSISTRKMSVSFWGKADSYSGTGTQWWQVCSFTCNDNTSFHIYCVPNARYKIEYKPELNAHCDTSAWRHITYVLDGTTVIAYVDGEQVGKATTENADRLLKAMTIGHNKICINDFRIYDHVLSIKEVKELAKGLILNMPLDNNGMSGINLLKGGYEVFTTKDGHSVSGSLSLDTDLISLQDLIGKTITFSFDYSCEGQKLNATGNYTKDRYGFHLAMSYTNASGNAGTSYPCTNYLEPVGTNRAIQTYSIPSTWKAINSFFVAIQPYNQPSADNNNIWYLKNVKLEIGDIATAYSPNPNDISFDALSIDDVSGYCHQGTAVQLMDISTNTPRYEMCTTWKDNKDFIHIPSFFAKDQQVEAITIAGWYKTDTLNGTAPNFFNFGANNFVRGRIASSSSLWSYWNIGGTRQGVSASTPSTSDNKWHHYAFSFNKGIVKTYFDGVLKNTSDFIATGTVLFCGQVTDWGLGGFAPTGEKFIGNQSDFRVYCTALSDDDIKSLYEGRSGVDKKGNFYVSRIQESTGIAPIITKRHVADVSGEFYEPGGMNLAYNVEPYDYTDVITGYVPKKDATNSCLSGFKVPYGAELNGKRARATVTVTWSGFDSSSTAGTFAMRFQGGQMTAAGGQSWTAATGKSNKLASAFASAQSLTTLVLGSASGQKTIAVEYTISAVAEQPGDFLGIRTDYSNGVGNIQLSNLNVALIDTTVSEQQKVKIGEKNIAANYIYEL